MKPAKTRRIAIYSQDQIDAFILGQCEEEVALRMEEHLFTDEAFYDRMEQAKALLIQREAAGTLPQSLSRQFQLQLQRSAELRAEVELARAEQMRVLAAETAVRLVGTSRRQRWSIPRFALLACASIAIVVVVGMLLRQSSWYTQRTANGQSATTSSEDAHAPARRAITAFLPVGTVRQESALPTVHVFKRDQPIELQLEVRSETQSQWSVSILKGGELVFQRDHLQIQADGPIHFVSLVLPPGTLQAGAYTAKLSQAESSTPSEPSSTTTRTFQVTQ